MVNIFNIPGDREKQAFQLAKEFSYKSGVSVGGRSDSIWNKWNKRIKTVMADNGYNRELAVEHTINNDNNFESLRT